VSRYRFSAIRFHAGRCSLGQENKKDEKRPDKEDQHGHEERERHVSRVLEQLLLVGYQDQLLGTPGLDELKIISFPLGRIVKTFLN
jgi:hypothetical protein